MDTNSHVDHVNKGKTVKSKELLDISEGDSKAKRKIYSRAF